MSILMVITCVWLRKFRTEMFLCLPFEFPQTFGTMLLLLLAPLLLGALIARAAYVVWRTGKPCPEIYGRKRPLKTLIVLGSGGHTAEMLNLVDILDKHRYYPRIYVAALTDNMSLSRAATMEALTTSEDHAQQGLQYLRIYRSREVGQSYVTSVITTIIASLHALWLVIRIRPHIILCNGPGTCIPICLAGFLLKASGIRWVVIVYVESIARVRHLSLSALILYKLKMADKVYVQWKKLQEKYPGCEFVDRLM